MTVKRGDKFVVGREDRLANRLFITVNGVAKDGSWADIFCQTWAVGWTKRQPLPLESAEPYAFTLYDLEQQEVDHMAMLREREAGRP